MSDNRGRSPQKPQKREELTAIKETNGLKVLDKKLVLCYLVVSLYFVLFSGVYEP